MKNAIQYPEVITAPYIESHVFFKEFHTAVINIFLDLVIFRYVRKTNMNIFITDRPGFNLSNIINDTFKSNHEKRTINTELFPALTSTEMYYMGVIVTGDPKEDIKRLLKYYTETPKERQPEVINKMIEGLKKLNKGGKK